MLQQQPSCGAVNSTAFIDLPESVAKVATNGAISVVLVRNLVPVAGDPEENLFHIDTNMDWGDNGRRSWGERASFRYVRGRFWTPKRGFRIVHFSPLFGAVGEIPALCHDRMMIAVKGQL